MSDVARGRRPNAVGRRTLIAFATALAATAGLRPPAQACDLCAIYTTTEERQDQTGLQLGVAEQFTYFHTLKLNGQEQTNPYGERIASSITQVFAGYNFIPLAGLQLNLPIISRSFRRLEADGVMDGNVSGIGDLSLIGHWKPLTWVDTSHVAHLMIFGGLKFPTGDPALLGEEVDEPCVPFPDPSACSGQHFVQRHVPAGLHPHHESGVPSGIHGHDLALGSGSVDGIVGAQAFATWRRAFASGSVQYLARTVGAFGYQYANDLLFNAGPGLYALLGDDWFGKAYALRLQVLLSGETKGTDTLQGEPVGDTGLTALYLGPDIGFAWGTQLALEIAAELPVLQNNTQLQIVPDYRLRGAVSWRF